MRNIKTVKRIVLLFMLLTLVVIVYGLGFFTDFLPIRSAYKDLYNELQVFNRAVFNYSFWALIPVALMFVFENHKTNQYKLTNKVFGLAGAAFALYQSYFVLSQLSGFRTKYLAIDPANVQLLYPDYQMNTAAFTFGYIIYGLLALAAILLILVTLLNKKDTTAVKEG